MGGRTDRRTVGHRRRTKNCTDSISMYRSHYLTDVYRKGKSLYSANKIKFHGKKVFEKSFGETGDLATPYTGKTRLQLLVREEKSP